MRSANLSRAVLSRANLAQAEALAARAESP
ncbi:MAG: hypothetical protein ACKO7W_14280 [Elainella sp.]